MNTVNTTRNTYSPAVQNAATTQPNNPTWTDADLIGQGTSQGVQVAELEQGNANFNINDYANSVVPYLQGLGLSNGQVSTYLSAMVSEFNYLTPTSHLDPQNQGVGSDIINQVLPNAAEPGQAENPSTTSPQTLLNQGTTLGQQLAAVQSTNSSNFDIASYTQNLVQQMHAAGYTTAQTDAFSSGLLMGYASALGGYLAD